MSGFLETIQKQVVVFDGAMGTMIRNYDIGPMDFGGEEFEMLSDVLSLSRPDIIKDIHIEYFKAGANAVETNTFGACPLRLKEFDFRNIDDSCFPQEIRDLGLKDLSYEDIAYHMNYYSCKIAKEAVQAIKSAPDYDGRPLFVIASIGPSNYVLSSTNADLHIGTWEDIEDNFYVQAKGLIDGGADVFLFETQQDILEVKAAVSGAFKAMKEKNVKIPVMCQVTVNEHSRMQIFNTDIHAALTTLAGTGIDVFGINCSIGPDLMEPTIKKISEYSSLGVSVLPNAGLPESENGETVYKLSPDDLAMYLAKFADNYGVNIVGGCCGTSPAHIKAVAEAVKGKVPFDNRKDKRLYLSGPQEAVPLDGSEELIRIGERLNIRGSKKVRDAVENEERVLDFDTLEEVVNDQVKDLGLSVIDVCMDSNQVDTKEVLPKVIRGITLDFQGVLCIDSFDGDALANAVKFYPGRPLVNSISMESHENTTKADFILEKTAFHSPAYIALAADDEGPAVTSEKKYEIALKLVQTAAKYNIPASQLLIDINAFPIGSESEEGMNFAIESLNSIKMIKSIDPEIKTTIGVSNLTNGLAKKPYMRKVLTSVFLDEGRKLGLDAAIVNPNHYVPVKSLDEKDYEIGLKVVLNKDMDAYAELEEIALAKKGKAVVKRSSYEGMAPALVVSEKIKDGHKSRKQGSLEFKGKTFEYADLIVEDAALALNDISPLDFINDYLMEAMNVLGDRFAKGEASLPHLLKAADIMKQVMNFIEWVMKDGQEGEDESEYKGTIVLGTVYQDVHSIGKDLTKTLFENYGYRVVDLGVQVPLESYIDAAVKENADAIGMSALLVQTSNHMLSVVKMMKEKGLDIPVFIGGAPVNMKHAAAVAMSGAESLDDIKPDVFYCQTAMDSVNVIGRLLGTKRDECIKENKEKLLAVLNEQNTKDQKELPAKLVSFDHEYKITPFEPEMKSLAVGDISIRQKNLFLINWKHKTKDLQDTEKLQEIENDYEFWLEKAKEYLNPVYAFGIFPCRKNKDKIDVFDPKDTKKLLASFETVVIRGQKEQFRISDFIREDEFDYIGLQIVTAGIDAEEKIKSFADKGDSEGAFLLSGIANRIAEDMASDVHNMLKQRAGVKKGARYSPGYPGMEVKENFKIYELLRAQNTGIKIADSGEFLPSCTTAALVCFHPEAHQG